MQACGNLPRGSNQTAQAWRAAYKLSYMVHSTYFWGEPLGTALPFMVTVLSRCLQNDSQLTAYVLQQAIDVVLAKDELHKKRKQLAHWSDGASHYKSKTMLSHWGYHAIQRYRVDTEVKFGLPEHMKGRIDRHSSVLDKRLERACMGDHRINSIAEVLDILRKGHKEALQPW